MSDLLYTVVSRHATLAYVNVQIGHPQNFTLSRAESIYSEVCSECQRLLKEDCVTFIHLTMFVYGHDISVWRVFPELQTKINLFRKLIGPEHNKISAVFITKARPPFFNIVAQKLAAFRLGMDICYAQPA